MDELTEIAQSLSHYIVILLVGYKLKKPLGERTPMPNVWIQRPTPDIIVNIWSFDGTSRSRALMMIPNSKVDHTIIMSDGGRDLKRLITEFAITKESTTVLSSSSSNSSSNSNSSTSKDDQALCREQGVPFANNYTLNEYITKVATEIYAIRVKDIDTKISLSLKE